MKKGVKITLMVVGIVMAVIIFFVGAFLLIVTSEDFGTSRKYRTYKHIFTEFNEGEEYTKESVFEIAQNPEYVYFANGERVAFINESEEEQKATAFQNNTVEWEYTCLQLGDSDPYRFEVQFDDNGNAIAMEFEPIPGG